MYWGTNRPRVVEGVTLSCQLAQHWGCSDQLRLHIGVACTCWCHHKEQVA